MAVLSCMAIDLAISLRIAVVVMVAMGPMAVRGQLIRLRSSMRGNKKGSGRPLDMFRHAIAWSFAYDSQATMCWIVMRGPTISSSSSPMLVASSLSSSPPRS